MNAYLFFITAFGMILVFKKENGPKTLNTMLPFLEEVLTLILGAVFLLLIYSFFLKIGIGLDFSREAGFFSAWIGAYAISQALKKKEEFFLVLLGLTVFLQSDSFVFSAGTSTALAHLGAGILIFEISMVGLRQRLLFSSLPQALLGLPIFLLTCALLTLSWTGILLVLAA
ncbi:MAG: hypothetical protein HYZ84_04610 [Candidatus Omnitrophica bacterium]|nr:hypothetical protein [Candidatus Omnitrophota bacterium]